MWMQIAGLAVAFAGGGLGTNMLISLRARRRRRLQAAATLLATLPAGPVRDALAPRLTQEMLIDARAEASSEISFREWQIGIGLGLLTITSTLVAAMAVVNRTQERSLGVIDRWVVPIGLVVLFIAAFAMLGFGLDRRATLVDRIRHEVWAERKG